jgi:Glycosyl hydrolase family 63 C-terminal domain
VHNSDQAERSRLAAADQDTALWREWGPYLSERAWGTVREDYSDYGDSWGYFPHDIARSRTYRWSEDGLGGICDDAQRFCFSFAFWNGEDSILKERIYGLTGPEGNHGEDAKEYWWYLDSTPTHSYMRWRYHYPQAAFPYAEIREANRTAGRGNPEFELLDTKVFDEDRYWSIDVDYAKASPHDMTMLVKVTNNGPDTATLHVLPTLWFRNTWGWTVPALAKPTIQASGAELVAQHAEMGQIILAGDGDPTALACDNETNAQRLWSLDGRSRYPKDGINDHVIDGAASVNPDGVGTKAALHYTLTVAAGGTAEIRLRLAADATTPDLGTDFDNVLASRAGEADAYFDDLTPEAASKDEARTLRQAVAGLMWSKQFYHYDVERWLHGDATAVPPSPARLNGRNSGWTHMKCHDVISMPDAWEYPWFAAWDLAFHCVAIGYIDPGFAKSQLSLLLDERYQHPDGQIPAYEWAFDDVNPPVQAWAALRVFHLDGGWDFDFLERLLPGLIRNFEWWSAAKAVGGTMNTFGGGFLGLDNVGPIERTHPPSGAGALVQADGTAWMAMFAAHLAEMAQILAERDSGHMVTAQTYRARFDDIVAAAYERGLWDEETGFFFDMLIEPDGTTQSVRARSVVGLLPVCAVAPPAGHTDVAGEPAPNAMVDGDRLRRVLARMLDEDEFLSPYGVRSLSAAHRAEPAAVTIEGITYTADYEPAESTTSTFGGNSNWRGPVWFPVNVLLVNALRDHQRRLGNDFTVAYPSGEGQLRHLGDVADELSARLISLFCGDESGRVPAYGWISEFQDDPRWNEGLMFFEYFHGDNGAGLGAGHQTGWTALVIDLICGRTRR